MQGSYPVQFDVDFPARPLDRLTTAFRIFVAIPILIVLGTLSGETLHASSRTATYTLASGGGLLFLPLVLMIVFRQKYPRWWFDWNLNLLRFSNRVTAYLALLDDHYPSTDEEQAVHLNFAYPDARQLNRWVPLVRVHATTVNRLDCATREANRRSGLAVSLIRRIVFGIRRPRRRILGSELAGVIEAVGATVKEFAVGDQVFGATGLGFGTHTEFVCMREKARLAHKPTAMSFEQAAAICDGAFNALSCLRQAHLRKGQTILIYGASGSIGTAGVQLARYFETNVMAVCSTKNLELVKSLGADAVIDYTQEDFTKNGATYDVIFDAVGKHSFRRCRGSLKPGGSYLATDGFRNLMLALCTWRIGDRKVMFSIPPRYTKQDVRFLKELIEAGRYRTA